jgi:hypothetical protein
MNSMRKFVVLLGLGVVVLLPYAIAQGSPAGVNAPVEKAKILDIKEYAQGRLWDWAGRVPVYDGYPFYDLTLDVGGKRYIARYESMTGYFPSTWKQGGDIDVKLANSRLYLLRDSEEIAAEDVSSTAQDCVQTNATDSTAVGPQVPCQ